MSVIVYVMTEKGLSVIGAIIEAKQTKLIDRIVIGKDASVMNDYSKEIEDLCRANDLVFSFRGDDFEMTSSYAIAISWRWLIPLEDKIQLIVLHDSLLPKYRGFAPLVNALINKEKNIGVTALFASEAYDAGPIISQKRVPVSYPITIQETIKKIGSLYQDIVLEILSNLTSEKALSATPQNDDQASYSLWRDHNDYFIDWHKSSKYIKRFIDAVGYPYQGAKCYLEGQEITILKASIRPNLKLENRHVGKVFLIEDGLPIIVCGKGLLRIEEATDTESKESILPLKKFRSRLT